MSNINKSKKEAVTLLEHVRDGKKSLTTNLEKYNKQIDEGYLGHKQGSEMFTEEKDNFISSTRKMAQNLAKTLVEYEQQDIERVKSTQDPVTADDVAELQLLAQIDTTSEELERYAEKYSNNSLALRRINKIASEQGIMFSLPESEEDKVRNSYNKLKRVAERYEFYQVPTTGNVTGIADDMTIDAELAELKQV